jgi:hypothetical protein
MQLGRKNWTKARLLVVYNCEINTKRELETCTTMK